MTKFVNLTPHPLRFRRSGDGAGHEPVPGERDIVVPPSGTVARVSSTRSGITGYAEGVPLVGPTIFGVVEGLPEPQPDTIYLVSALVGGRVADRGDVFIPGTGPQDQTIRSADGQVFAVTRLIQAG